MKQKKSIVFLSIIVILGFALGVVIKPIKIKYLDLAESTWINLNKYDETNELNRSFRNGEINKTEYEIRLKEIKDKYARDPNKIYEIGLADPPFYKDPIFVTGLLNFYRTCKYDKITTYRGVEKLSSRTEIKDCSYKLGSISMFFG